MAGYTLIIVMAAALLLAVSVLLFGVGRIVYGIAHYYIREKQPTRELRHPVYGLLVGEGILWSGSAHPNGREVRFTVGGTDVAPDDLLLRRIDAIVGEFPEVERHAVDYLRAHEVEIRNASFEIYRIEVTNENHPDDFRLEFVVAGDDSRVWFVEFEAGQPRRTGFDD